MSKKRRQYSSEFKAKVALAALKGDETTSALAARFEIHPSMVSQWKRELLDNAAGLFEGSGGKAAQKSQEEVDTLYREIGKLTVERDFLSRKARALSRAQRLAMIEPSTPDTPSLRRQCQLLGISRSSLYYQRREWLAEDLALMRLIDEQHLLTPVYGSRRMTAHLNRLGRRINRKRVRRLMRQMGLQAIYPRPRTSLPGKGHRIYPYRLRGLTIDRPNQVWATDISYIPLARGFMYLVAVMDWHSRRVLSWRVSNTLDTDFCIDALEEALSRHGPPEIFNTDQGCQFTSQAFTDVLEAHGVTISMDGKGCYRDNIFVERLWRSVKYECVYLKAFKDGAQLKEELGHYFTWYNQERPHQGLDDATPDELYFAQPLNKAA
ncbi:IS3 family transposase [Chromohalobacter salexigens]|nr:IS3 family transposase [Chromohalobacter salexigens]MBZ5875249.1 IS3 family transposase [Chromohalobacter salexigens]